MKPFLLRIDRNRQNTLIRPAPDYVEVVVLAQDTEQTIPVPAAAAEGYVIFSADGEFWARPNAVAAVPTSTSNDGGGSERSPSAWGLESVTSIHLVASAARKISLAFYAR